MSDELKRDALAYHAAEPAGKLQILPTKPMATQRDLALAYSPGVAYACTEIADDPSTAALYTGRANLVAVISNGTAVLGLGNIGALASKPVMEGKAALFKKFSGIDVSTSRSTRPRSTPSSRRSPGSSRPSAASTSRTSAPRPASRSRSG